MRKVFIFNCLFNNKIRNLIIGIDPGTNLAYSLVDLEGNVIKVKCSKHSSLNIVLREVSEYGKVLAIGTDKYPAPSFVKKFAAISGARLIEVKRDIKIEKKKEIIDGYKVRNKHERDSLAAAFIAYKRLKLLFRKVDDYLAKRNLLWMSKEMKKVMIVNKEGATLYETVKNLKNTIPDNQP